MATQNIIVQRYRLVTSSSSHQVWDASGSGCIRWDAKDLTGPDHAPGTSEHMGCVVENSVIQASLLAATQRVIVDDRSATSFSRSSAPPLPPHGTSSLVWPASIVALGLPSQMGAVTAVPATEASSTSSAASTSSGLAWLQLQDGRRLHARLVVAADGSASKVRSLAGMRTSGHDYHQRGLVATVRTSGADK